jgi:hypothetical protein
MFLFGVFGGMCGESQTRNVFMLLFVDLWVPIAAMLCRRAVLMVWLAFLFLGLRFFPLFALWLMLLFLIRIFYYKRSME